MLNLGIKKKKALVVMSFLLLIPFVANSVPTTFAAPTSFLPMEDAFSTARSRPEFVNENIKPYRESFNLGNENTRNGYIDFTSTDILAFVFLVGVYLMFVRRNSQSRNASF